MLDYYSTYVTRYLSFSAIQLRLLPQVQDIAQPPLQRIHIQILQSLPQLLLSDLVTWLHDLGA